jgi:CubicO group peptidase (beta-lactamase class C family)
MTTRHNFLRRSFALFVPCFVLLASPVTPARGQEIQGTFAPEKLERITQLMQDAVDQKRIAGGAALIARHGKIAYLQAVGMQDVKNKVPLTASTIFRIASMTKPVTAVAIMILADDGKLRVTDPLSRYLPEFKEMTVLVPSKDGKSYEILKAAREITLHDLLTHTSGLTYRFFDKPFVGQMYSAAGVSDGLVETPGTIGGNVRKLAKLPLVCQPGTAWEYGLSFDVLGRVVEVASGKSLAEFCRERIFGPLKMEDTGFFLPKEKWPRLSALYTPGPDQTLTQLGAEPITAGTFVFSASVPLHEDGRYYSGGAGLVSTLGDYFRFCHMLLNRGELDGARVLKPDTVDRITRNQVGELRLWNSSIAMGYGVGVATATGKNREQKSAGVGSYFWSGAFYTVFWVDPDAEVIGIFMAQRFPFEGAPLNEVLGQEIKRLTYEAMTEAGK